MEIIMADENEGELTSAADISAARAALMSDPPPILDPTEPVVVDETDDENAALDELTGTAAEPGTDPTVTPPVAPAPASSDPYAAFGGEEAVRTAYQVQEAMRTEQGVRALVANGLQALGYSVDAVREALAAPEAGTAPAPPTAAVDPFAGLEGDDMVTVDAVKNYIQAQVAAATEQSAAVAQQLAQQQNQPLAAVVQQQQASAVRTSTDAAVIEALGAVPTDPAELTAYRQQVDAIVERGARYYDPNQWANPSHIREAVQKAHAELTNEADLRFKAYLAGKKRARSEAPPNVGGGAGGEGPIAEPKNLAEARKQARDSGFFG